MHKTDPRMLEDVEITTAAHAITLQGPVKNVSDWLQIRHLLPFSAGQKFFLKTPLRSTGENAAVHFINVSTQGSQDSTRNRPRRFGMAFSAEEKLIGNAKVEFSVKPTAAVIELALELLSVDASVLESPEMASVLVLALSTFMDSMSSGVVQVFHAASTKAVAKTPILFTLAMPDSDYADLLKETVVDLELALAASPNALKYRPTVRGILGETLAVGISPEGADKLRVTLGERQRLALAETLKSLREAKGLSQMEVARDALGLTKSHAAVSRLERGLNEEVELERLEQLANFFGTNLAFLNNAAETKLAA